MIKKIKEPDDDDEYEPQTQMADNGEERRSFLSRTTISITLISRLFGIVSNNRGRIGLFRQLASSKL